jgi:ATP/maltotriose-dependent transcriptional regulator MalT
MTATVWQEGPDVDPLDLLRRISMVMIARGHDRLGGRMLDALRPQMADPADADASIALAELSRGDIAQARQRLEREVLALKPSHPMALLVKAACDRAEGVEHWQRGPNAVLATTDEPQWRQAALAMLND